MTQRILIDAVHPEEVRVVLAQDNRLEEFDFETAAKKQIKGNIYLGKITRVEPSLQAAFVEYGGQRQGFLPFAEVHFDYYQIPTEDRDKIADLLEKERASREEDSSEDEDKTMAARAPKDPTTTADADDKPKKAVRKTPARKTAVKKPGKAAEKEAAKKEIKEAVAESAAPEAPKPERKKALVDEAARRKAEELERAFAEEFSGVTAPEAATEAPAEAAATPEVAEGQEGRPHHRGGRDRNRDRNRRGRHGRDRDRSAEGSERGEDEEGSEKSEHEDLGGDDFEESRAQRSQIFRNYKIQEVLKRNQIVLVQVIKEERGNKGASLTTYISLAGRYAVLMPNTDRGGGISRRITDIQMRKQLKSLLTGMNMPKGASVIIRTAGMDRAVEDISHDFNYLLELWETIRQRAVKATAPALIHEEGNLIKRSLRDMFRHTVTDVVVDGAAGYATAKEFMDAMAPESVSKLKEYSGSEPLFKHYGIDAQLDELYDNNARLPSGGAIVITPTEALVSIDVNSGRSTRERSIEDTAVKTNLEAAAEIARQLRLRDLAGLVVIDFIDMRELRNRRAVEGALKKALKTDRARIQVGRISPFGLLEMSRQRMRSSIVESSTVACAACGGTGFVRSDESTALKLLRVIEAEAQKGQSPEINIRTATQAAFYLLNNKREELSAIEKASNVKISVDHDHTLAGAEFALDRQRGGGQARRPDERGGERDRNDRNSRGGRDRDRGGRDRGRDRDRGGRDRNRDNREQGGEQPVAEASPEAAEVDQDAQPASLQNGDNQHHERSDRNNNRGGRNRNRDRNRNRGGQHGGQHQGQGGQGQGGGQQRHQGQHQNQHQGLPQDEPESFPSSENIADLPANDMGGDGQDDGKDSSRLRGLWKKITQ